MESIALPSTLPTPLEMVHLAHFSNLDPTTQSASIIRRIISASKLPVKGSSSASEQEIQEADEERRQLDFAFIDPTKLCCKQHILTAVMQAVVVCARSWQPDEQRFREGEGSSGGMKSKTPHSEIIYMLSPGNNVGESLKRFGLSSKSTSLLLVKFSSTDADKQAILDSMLQVVDQTTQLPETSASPSASETKPSRSHLTAPSSGSMPSQPDIDQAIRYNKYLAPASDGSIPPLPVTDWKDLNKIYKLQIPNDVLSSLDPAKLRKFEEIVCTTVAMKLVAA